MATISLAEWIQIVTLLFIAPTVVIYFRQLRAMQAASKGQNILALVNFLQAQHVRDARKIVRNQLANKEENT
jgi:hypothetical protein